MSDFITFLKKAGDKIEDFVVCLTMYFTTFLIFIEVFRRYVLHNSSSWGEELSRYLFICMVYMGASLAVKYNKHICIDIIHELKLLPQKAKTAITIFADSCFFLFTLVIIKYGVDLVMMQFNVQQIASGLKIPLAYPYLAIPIGFTFISIRLAQKITREVKILLTKESIRS